MQEYRLVVSDLDGTLIGTDHTVPDRNIQAIREAREKGIVFVPATGRSYPSVGNLLEQIGTGRRDKEYVITLNGGVIVENGSRRLLHVESLPLNTAEELYRRGIALGACMHIYTVDRVFGRNLGKLENEYMQRLMAIEETDADDLGFLAGAPVIKILVGLEEEQALKRLEKEILTDIGGLETTYSSPQSLEVMKAGVTKGNALNILASVLQIPLEAAIAVGDNFNDISMLERAGLGAAVANAEKAVREKADIVTDSDNDHGAVGELIEMYILRKERKA